MTEWSFTAAAQSVNALQLRGPNRDVAAHWLSLWSGGKAPSRASFCRKRGWAHWPAIAIFESQKDRAVLCLQAGSYFGLALGFDPVGLDTLSLVPAAERRERMDRTWAVASGGVMAAMRDFGAGPALARAQEVYLPFCDAPDDTTRYHLLHTNWRPVGSEWLAGPARTSAGLAGTFSVKPAAGPSASAGL